MTTRHQHVCGCGDYFMCSQEPDRCPREPWQCDACAMNQRDEFFNAALRMKQRIDQITLSPTSPFTNKEPTSHEKQ